MRPWKILCDFDGTISVPDATDALLEQCARAEWVDLERQWRDGSIGSRECMTRQIALIVASEDEIDSVSDRIPIDPAFPKFVAHATRLGVELVVVSDGLDRVIHRILANNGLDHLPVIANRLAQVGPRQWAMQSPHAAVTCAAQSGTCKCACAMSSAATGNRILLIGDGQSDVCVAARADFVFAKGRLRSYCQDAGIAHRSFHGFDELVAMLTHLVHGVLDVDATPIPPYSSRIEYA